MATAEIVTKDQSALVPFSSPTDPAPSIPHAYALPSSSQPQIEPITNNNNNNQSNDNDNHNQPDALALKHSSIRRVLISQISCNTHIAEQQEIAESQIKKAVSFQGIKIGNEHAEVEEAPELLTPAAISHPAFITPRLRREDTGILGSFLSRYIPKRILGICYLAISAVLFSVMALLVSQLSVNMPSFQIVHIRCTIQFFCALLSCRFYSINFLGPTEKRKWILLRGSLGFISFSCYYFAISALTLSDATTIFFSAPVYAGLLGYFVLKEPISKVEILCTAGSIVGVVMIVRPPFIFGSQADNSVESNVDGSSGSSVDSNHLSSSTFHTLGLLAAIAGSIFGACVYITIRKVGSGVHPLVLVCYMGMVGFILAPFGALFQTFVLPTGLEWFFCICVGLLSFIGQIFFNRGVQLEKAGLSSVIRNLDVAFAFFWQVTIQHLYPNIWSLLGALIISTAVVMIGWMKMKGRGTGGGEKTNNADISPTHTTNPNLPSSFDNPSPSPPPSSATVSTAADSNPFEDVQLEQIHVQQEEIADTTQPPSTNSSSSSSPTLHLETIVADSNSNDAAAITASSSPEILIQEDDAENPFLENRTTVTHQQQLGGTLQA